MNIVVEKKMFLCFVSNFVQSLAKEKTMAFRVHGRVQVSIWKNYLRLPKKKAKGKKRRKHCEHGIYLFQLVNAA